MDNQNSGINVVPTTATQPIFVNDRDLERPTDISWEITGEADPIIEEKIEPFLEEEEKDIDSLEENPEEVEEEDDEEKEKIKKKSNRVSERKRIAELTRKLKQAQSVAHDVLSRNQYLESKISQKDKESALSHENLLAERKERVKQYLMDAIEEGDPNKITEANDLLSQYNAEISVHKQKVSASESLPYPQQQYTSYEDNNPIDDIYEENAMEWIDKNPWVNPKSGKDYDKEMHDAAAEYETKLLRKYKLSGRTDKIGTPEFFNEISNHIMDKFDIFDDVSPPKNQTKERMTMKTNGSSPVAPVNRSSNTSGAPRNKQEIILTQEQKEAAHAMRGYVRDSKGTRITDNKSLEEIYKRNLKGYM